MDDLLIRNGEVVDDSGAPLRRSDIARLAVVADHLAAMAPARMLCETSFAAYIESFPATSVNVAHRCNGSGKPRAYRGRACSNA
jgi:hypothetical protein